MPVETYKYFGLLAIAIFWFVILITLRKWRGDRSMSISMHMASAKTAYIIFAVASPLLQSLFFLFIAYWFTPGYGLGVAYATMVTAGIVGQVLAAWIPDTRGLASTIHRGCAVLMGTTMLASTVWLITAPTIPYIWRVYCLVAASVMLFIYTRLAASAAARKHFLLYQSCFLLLFHTSILVVAYL